MKVHNNIKYNGEWINYKTVIIIGVIAFIYSILPVFIDTDYMKNKGITILLIFITFPATGIYSLADWYFADYKIAKFIAIIISTVVMWLLFALIWTNHVYKTKEK